MFHAANRARRPRAAKAERRRWCRARGARATGDLQFDLAGGGIENWFAYVLALVFLLFRPQGLFGERIIERV